MSAKAGTAELQQNLIYKKPNNLFLLIKRIWDIGMSSVILVVTAPVMAILIALIKLESKGPAFYIQKRVGQFGNIFNVYKLRTMLVNSEESGGGVKTIQNDPRITKIGKLIRDCSLDEFPQFFNILKGEMSFIGPRPISTDEHNFVLNYLNKGNKQVPQGVIHNIKPGITGWALLHGREKISYEDRFKLNAEYENNMSLMFDLKIFYLTFKKYSFTYLCVIGLFLAFIGLILYKFL